MKRGKPVRTQGIRLDDKVVVDIKETGYKYLGILEWNKIKEKKMKEKFRLEYLRLIDFEIKTKWAEQSTGHKHMGGVTDAIWGCNNKLEKG